MESNSSFAITWCVPMYRTKHVPCDCPFARFAVAWAALCVYWLVEGKSGKKYCKLTHTAAVPTTTITIDTYAWYRAHHGRQHLLWLMLTHNFFVECCTLKYILFGMQIVWRREESVKRRNIPFGKCVRHTTSTEQHPAKREKREKIARFYIFSLNC